MYAVPSPNFEARCSTCTRVSISAASRSAMWPVPSAELSSTTSTSNSSPWSRIAATIRSRFSRSLKVGRMTSDLADMGSVVPAYVTMSLAIRCGTLIDGTGADPVPNAFVVTDDDSISAITTNRQAPRDTDVIDASHLTVMPGMIDCHVHLASSTWGLQERLLTPYSLMMAHALNHARITLEAGFTMVRDAAGTPRGIKMAIEQGLFPGPRVLISVSALSQTGGHGDSTMPNGANIRLGNA